MSFNVDCATLPTHIAERCDDPVMGGIPSYAVVDKDATVVGDWDNSTKWLADIASGKVKVVNRVKFTLPFPSPQQTDNLVANGAQQTLDGFDWTVEGVDGNVSTFNDDFYQTLNKKNAYLVLWVEDEDQISVVDKPVTFAAMPTIPNSNREKQHYQITAQFSSKKDWFPTRKTAPTGVFEL